MSLAPVGRDRKDNLFEAIPGDHGAHGRFDREAKPTSAALWIAMHPTLGMVALAGIAGVAVALRYKRSAPAL